MKKALAALAVLSLSTATGAAESVSVQGAPWKDVSNCMVDAKGKVVSATPAKVGGAAGVTVKSKTAKGKVQTSGIQGAKVTDFPVGSDFCKMDFGAD